MEKFSADDLADYLKRRLSDAQKDSINILANEKIDGSVALALEIKDFHNMGIPYGHAVAIKQAISNFVEDDSQAGNEKQSVEDMEDNDSESDSSFSDISEFFSEEHFKSLSSYEKKSYRSIKNNFDKLEKDHGSSLKLKKPAFMSGCFLKKSSSKKPKSAGSMKEMSAADSTASKSTKTDQNCAGPSKASTSKSACSESCNQDKNTGPVKASSSNTNKGSNLSKRHSNESIQEGNLSGPSSRKDSQKRTKKQPQFCFGPKDMSEDEYAETLPTYDIESILLEAGDKLEKVRSNLEKNGIVYDTERKCMVRALTRHVYFKKYPNPAQVNSFDKEGIAAAIVKKYPAFRDDTQDLKYSWHRFFDRKSNSGFIANCVQNIYRQMDKKDRRRTGRKDSGNKENDALDLSDSAEVDPADHNWIGLLMPTKSNKTKILNAMGDTYRSRRKWIKDNSPTITEVILHYPHLLSFDGEVLIEEFNRIVGEEASSNLLEIFPGLIRKLQELKEFDDFNEINSEIIQACKCIADLLPRQNLQRRKDRRRSERVVPSLDTLIVPVQRGVDLQSVITEKRAKCNGPVQPYLIGLMSSGKDVVKVFVVADSSLVELKTPSVLQGLDLLFKTYTVFHVEYPLGWKGMFEFLEYCVYKINPHNMTNTMFELQKRLELS